MDGHLKPRPCAAGVIAAAAVVFMVTARPAFAVDQVHDEIQVYNAEIAEVGQWTYEQHLNYAAVGQTQPEFPGGFTSNHGLQGTAEFAYGMTNWWEAGFYLPFAIKAQASSFPMGPRSAAYSWSLTPPNAASSMGSISSLVTRCRNSR